MSTKIQIKNALISVFNKDGLDKIAEILHKNKVQIFSTGGTEKFLKDKGYNITSVESLTSYPSILGGRVKTLHPKVFGGILARRENGEDVATLDEYEIPSFDLVIVDLYPFEKTVASTKNESEIIEKIDIGGVSLIRAAAKNYKDVLVCSNRNSYEQVQAILEKENCSSTLEDRKHFAAKAFGETSHYDAAIFSWFNQSENIPELRLSFSHQKTLRYGENPHQKASYYGDLDNLFKQLHGKELSYNNLLDVDGALGLLNEFTETAFVIVKHTNACGVAVDNDLLNCWKKALAGDPVSAFGGIIAANKTITKEVAAAIDEIFFEIVIAPAYEAEALDILQRKKNRMILELKNMPVLTTNYRSALNGLLVQDKDNMISNKSTIQYVTTRKPSDKEIEELLFAEKICKHLKSNTIVLAKNGQLLGMGCGQTSRVDALKQAINKAKAFGFDLNGAAMASDAFFPFPDCVEIANIEGVNLVIQPGGSVKDKDSIAYCDAHGMAMVFTGQRHFKH